MYTRFCRTCLLTGVLLGTWESSPLRAADEADKLLPPTTVVYASVVDPQGLVDFVYDHPVREKVEKTGAYQRAILQKQFVQFGFGLAFVENQLGKSWREAVGSLLGGGVHVAVDAKTQGVVLLARSTDEAFLNKTRDTLLRFVRSDAEKKGNPDPIKTGEYRGLTGYKVNDDATLVTFGPWLMVTNKSELGKQVIDRHLDGGQSLADNERFVSVRKGLPGQPKAWAYVDLQALRDAGVANQLFKGQANDFGAELIFGGVLANLQHAGHAQAALYADGNSVRLALATPHQAEWTAGPREHFFGPEGQGASPGLLAPPGTVLSISTYRNLSALWLQAGDLLDQRASDQLAEAESGLSNLFAGKDFAEDILGAVHPELHLVVARQKFETKPQPAIRLPSFALVARLRDPEQMRPDFRRTFQSLVGFLNIVGAMNGQPQLDLGGESLDGDAELVTSSFVPEPKEKDSERARINFNFSPSVGFRGERLVVSSSTELARQLLSAEPQPAERAANTVADADASVLTQLLRDNRGQLIAQNMLEEGHTREEAETEIDTILELVSLVKRAGVSLAADDQLRLDLQLELAP